jgi:hypothetical protein
MRPPRPALCVHGKELIPHGGPDLELAVDRARQRGGHHGLKNISDGVGRLLEWTVPGSNSDYFRAKHEMEQNGRFNPETFAAINKQFVTEFVV